MRDDSSWIQTFTGRKVWPLDPEPGDFVIEDIAHALSLLCRYGGHCKDFYSVAQHSVHVAELVPQHLRLTALLHDASEAYTADIVRPVKHKLPDYLKLEQKLEETIAVQYNLFFPYPKEIKDADNVVLNTERRDLLGKPPRPYNQNGVGICEKTIAPWSSKVAESVFLECYYALKL